MSLIGTGAFHRGQALEGFGGYANTEAQIQGTKEQIKAAEKAAEMQMLSTGAGIGASYGLMRHFRGTEAGNSMAGVGGISKGAIAADAGVTASTVGEVVPAINTSIGGVSKGAIAADAATTASAVGEVGATAAAAGEVGATAAAAGEVGATAAAAGNVGAAASGGSGALAGLSSLAAPVAIGLGVAFLLNKLFK